MGLLFEMGVRYNVAILANAGVAGALAWDHKTQHKLRQMKGEWSPRQSAIRIANLIPWQPAMSSEGVQERHGMDGAKVNNLPTPPPFPPPHPGTLSMSGLLVYFQSTFFFSFKIDTKPKNANLDTYLQCDSTICHIVLSVFPPFAALLLCWWSGLRCYGK